MLVPACDAGLTFSGQVATCAGNWAVLEVSNSLSPFDPSTLDPALIADAFGAGLLLPATALLTIHAGRAILNVIKES